jgi:hypothetical protein
MITAQKEPPEYRITEFLKLDSMHTLLTNKRKLNNNAFVPVACTSP